MKNSGYIFLKGKWNQNVIEIFLGLIQIIRMVYCIIYQKNRKMKKNKFLIDYISLNNEPNNKRIEPKEKSD